MNTVFVQNGRYINNEARIDGKVVVITGANSGIGKETALQLAKRGGKIYLACRSEDRGLAAEKDLREKSGNENVHFMKIDLASQESIREFSRNFHAAEKKLDVLINNAGILGSKQVTAEGIEMNIGVNHIGHFLLTNLLLDLLKAAAPSRVITIASEIHHTSEIKKDEFERNKSFHMWKQFAHSKLANVLFMRELAKKLEGTGVTSNGLCPGAINTEAIDQFNIFVRIIMYPIRKLCFKSVTIGGETPTMLAVEPQLEKVNGVFYKFCEPRPTSASAQNDEIASWLWDESVKLTGL